MNKRNPNFASYGGRGIKVRVRWNLFENFLYDMGQPGQGQELDRIDVNGDYYPMNCRWVSRKENMRNRRNTFFVEWRGERKSVGEWAEIVGLPWPTLKRRIERGWQIERAMQP